MPAYILRRLLYSLFVLWGAATIVFVAIRVVPGDPALLMLGSDATPDQLAALRARLQLNEPLPVQYARFLGQVAVLDFGTSLRLSQPAAQVIGERLPATVELALTAMVIALLLSFPLGIFGALHRGGAVDSVVSTVSLLGQAVPNFWLGIMLILLFARELRLLPSAGSGSWQSFVLPSVTLALSLIGVLTRLVRSGMLEVLAEDYVRTARAKGLTRVAVLARHALPNMLIPVITVVGLQLGHLLGGTVIVETVFGWPGIGRLLVDAIGNRDYPLVQAAIIVITGGFICINFLVDLSYGYLDPRIRLA
ncbi:MAG TPA: ABC transporter permease [Chloroflexota bacterium]|jgi:peptide/nickel transport system permease protein/oligopeptide transport system permease protein|nr:ABC transporter permease [Chloroflexota bacterium]